MNRYGYDGDKRYKPMTPWGYVRYAILFMIPVVGLLFLIIFSCSSGNINRRSYARSYWCWLFLCVIVLAVLAVLGSIGVIANMGDWPKIVKSVPVIQEFFDGFNDAESAVDSESVPHIELTSLPTTAKLASEPEKTPTPTETGESATQTDSIPAGVSKEFYETMVAYEAFFDEYIEFMEKYANSNSPASMLKDYSSFVEQYTESVEALDEIDELILTKEEDQMYTETLLRINNKLAAYAITFE